MLMRTDPTDPTPNQTRTATTDPDDAPIVHWPEPSRLDSWWRAIMRPSRPAT